MRHELIKHESIRNVYSNVITIDGDSGAWDKDGNVVVLDESLVQAEENRLQAEYDSQEYARNREAEYPSIQELVVALYDADDKADIEAKRAEVKAKYPKP